MAKSLADLRLRVKQIFFLIFFLCVFKEVVVTFLRLMKITQLR